VPCSTAAPIRSCSRWGLPCRPCCQGCGALLPHRFALARGTPCGSCAGGLFSVALSLGSPPPAISRHRIPVEPGLSSDASRYQRPSGRLAGEEMGGVRGWRQACGAGARERVEVGQFAGLLVSERTPLRRRVVQRLSRKRTRIAVTCISTAILDRLPGKFLNPPTSSASALVSGNYSCKSKRIHSVTSRVALTRTPFRSVILLRQGDHSRKTIETGRWACGRSTRTRIRARASQARRASSEMRGSRLSKRWKVPDMVSRVKASKSPKRS
jgi:hypothetical protein